MDIADTGETLLRLVGSFPKARLVLREVAGADVRRFACRRFVGRRMDDSI